VTLSKQKQLKMPAILFGKNRSICEFYYNIQLSSKREHSQLSDFSAGTTTLKLVVMSGKEVVGQSDIPLNNIIEDPDSYLNEKKFEYKHLFVYLSS
jgi:hypothetical protein